MSAARVLRLGDHRDEASRAALAGRLLHAYREDPDPGTHAAIDWVLRRWGHGDGVASIDRQLAGQPPGARRWYVTREGHTLTMVRGPVEFRMGSPAREPGRTPDEARRRVRIPRSFALSSKEVTIAQFRRFLDANPDVRSRHAYADAPERMAQVLARLSPDDDGPQIAVTWYEAAMYCNWLSRQEGLPESEWPYPAHFDDIRDGMEMPADYLRRVGYRLPTEAEWEYGARAGSSTPRFFGASTARLKDYAWYSTAPPARKGDPVSALDPQRTSPVGRLRPNPLGLFDVYGNVWEWCQDRRQEYTKDDAVHEDREDAVRRVVDTEARTRRGGSFSYGAEVMRSAHRGAMNYFPMQRRDTVGFRIARTIPADSPRKQWVK